MSPPLMNRRLQVLLDDDRHERLSAIAAERGVSVATVVREAIDRGLPDVNDRKAQAGRRILEAPEMPVPDVPELLVEIDELRGRRSG